MKKISAILILLLIVFIIPLTVYAQNKENNIVLSRDEEINRDYFAAGDTITIEGTINGDAYLAAGNIAISGTINGDLIAAGGNLEIRGPVAGNIRAAGGNLNINTTVGRNVTALGGSINLSSESEVTGSLVAAGGNITILSPIGGGVNLAGGQVTLGNTIGSDVNAAVGRLSLTPSASVNGDLTYLSKDKAFISPEATVSGVITQNIPQDEDPQAVVRQKGAELLNFFRIASFILAAIIGLLLIRFFGRIMDKTAEIILRRPWVSLGIGFLTLVAFPFVFLLLLVTIIGIPVAFILVFLLILYFYFSKIIISYVLGLQAMRRISGNTSKYWSFLLGLIIYSLLTFIPFLGWLISFISGLIGLGAIFIIKRNIYHDLHTRKII